MKYLMIAIILFLTSFLTLAQTSTNDIVFQGNSGNVSSIYSIDRHGAGQMNLSGGLDPSWSPNGTKIVFSGGNRIWVMDADGTNHFQLTLCGAGGCSSPVYSPDGTKFAYVYDGHGFEPASIFVWDLVRGELKQLTFITSWLDLSEFERLTKIDWSPDGSKIVFSRYETNGGANIYVINADGTGEVALTHDVGKIYNLDPNWSPNGSKIAFSNQGDVLVRPTVICTINADGTNRNCITWDYKRDDNYPSWSPDGSRLAFSGRTLSTNVAQIYTVNANGTALMQVTQNAFDSIAPDWRPKVSISQRTLFDYDGDGRSDISVFRPSDGVWYLMQSGSSSVRAQGWGLATDKLAPADFDGDGKTDLAVFRESDSNWYIFNSATNTATTAGWGLAGDLPVPADYGGDGKADIAVYRPSEGNWYRRDSDGQIHVYAWGLAGDKPAPADFNGDGVADMTVFRPSEGKWYTINSGSGAISQGTWGVAGDVPVPGDYSGDGKADFAVFRPSDQTWYRIHSGNFSIHIITWGLAGDFPTAGDYDGDGKQDLAVFRPSNATWFINSSTSGIYSQPFGLTGDIPTPNAFVY